MNDRLGLVAAFSKPEAQELAETITTYLQDRGKTAVPEEEIVADIDPNVDAIIVLGGWFDDANGKRLSGCPPIGINSGKVGSWHWWNNPSGEKRSISSWRAITT